MDFFDITHTRRSIRKFENRPVEQEKIMRLLEAALRAPSARSGRPWEFVVITDGKLLNKLSTTRPGGSAFFKSAPLAIAVCADPEKSAPWIEDASIAAITIQYAAVAQGLGSCWSQMRMREHNDQMSAGQYVADILDLPANLELECILAIGYPAESKPAYAKDELLFDRISYNRFGRHQAQ
jgi:nitroreductase